MPSFLTGGVQRASCAGVTPCRSATVASAYHANRCDGPLAGQNSASFQLAHPAGMLSDEWHAGRHGRCGRWRVVALPPVGAALWTSTPGAARGGPPPPSLTVVQERCCSCVAGSVQLGGRSYDSTLPAPHPLPPHHWPVRPFLSRVLAKHRRLWTQTAHVHNMQRWWNGRFR
jgi:hypothetical protein